MELLYWLFVGIAGILVLPLAFLMYLYPFLRIHALSIRFKRIKAATEAFKNDKQTREKISQKIVENKAAQEKLTEITGSDESLNDILKNKAEITILKFQDEILELERESNSEPRMWWSKRYCEKLQKLKVGVRVLLQEIRMQ